MARVPEGALMQRAAAGLAAPWWTSSGRRTGGGCCCWSAPATTAATRCGPEPCWPAAGCGSRRGCSATRRTPAGTLALAARRGPACVSGPANRARGRRRRHRRDRRPGRAARDGRQRARSCCTACRSWRSTPPAASASTPARSRREGRHVEAALTVTFGTHKVAATSSTRRPRRAARCTSSTSASTCPRRRWRRCSPRTSRRCCRGRRRTSQKYTRGVVGVRAGQRAVPRRRPCSASPARRAGWPGWSGTSATRRSRTRVRTQHPEVVGAGRVQAWVVGSGGGEGAGDQLAQALGDGVPVVVDADALAHVDAPVRRARCSPRTPASSPAMLGVDRQASRRGRCSSPARPRRSTPPWCCSRGAAPWSPDPDGTGPRQHDRHRLAGDRGRGRRARRGDRRAAGRRPDAVRRRVASAPGCTARPPPSPRAAARSSPARSRGLPGRAAPRRPLSGRSAGMSRRPRRDRGRRRPRSATTCGCSGELGRHAV